MPTSRRNRAVAAARSAIRRCADELDHRRGQHDAVEPLPPVLHRADQHRRAHRMAERVIRRRAVGQHDLLHEGFEVAVVFGEVVDVALARIRQRAVREPLPAPVEDRDREAARARVAHHLEIFLDEFRAARETRTACPCGRAADRSARSAAARRPRSSRFRRSRPREPDWRGWRRVSWEPECERRFRPL